jgi:hypothetical protein
MVTRYPLAGELVSLRDTMDRLMTDAFGASPFRSFWPATNGATRMTLPLDFRTQSPKQSSRQPARRANRSG